MRNWSNGCWRSRWITPSRSNWRRRSPACTRHRTSTSSGELKFATARPYQGKDLRVTTCGLAVCAPRRHTVSVDRATSAREFTVDSNAAVERPVCLCILSTNQLLLHCAEPVAGFTHRSMPGYTPRLMQAEEQPQNGIAGLKHWRNDFGAGLKVALLSLPLSPGIAVASGAPPISGKMTASQGRLRHLASGSAFY